MAAAFTDQYDRKLVRDPYSSRQDHRDGRGRKGGGGIPPRFYSCTGQQGRLLVRDASARRPYRSTHAHSREPDGNGYSSNLSNNLPRNIARQGAGRESRRGEILRSGTKIGSPVYRSRAGNDTDVRPYQLQNFGNKKQEDNAKS